MNSPASSPTLSQTFDNSPGLAWNGELFCRDCLDLMAQIEFESIKVVVTSPPYNLKNSTGIGMKDGRGGKWSNAALIKGYDSHQDMMPH